MNIFVYLGLAVGEIPPLMKQASNESNRLFFEVVADFEIFRYQLLSIFCCLKVNDNINYNFKDFNTISTCERIRNFLLKFFTGSKTLDEEPESKDNDQSEENNMVLRDLKKKMQILVVKTKTAKDMNDDSD